MVDKDAIRSTVGDMTLPDSGWARAICPLCVESGWDGTNQNLSYNVDSSYFYCHRCHAAGYLDSGRQRLPAVVRVKAAPVAVEPPRLPPTIFALDGSTRSAPFVSYLLGRGVSWEAIQGACLGGVDLGFYQDHLIVPVVDQGYRYQGFVARNIKVKDYRYPKGMDRVLSMFNAPRLLDPAPVLIVEGVFDALPWWPHAVACLGKPVPKQLAIIAAARQKIFLDPENISSQRGGNSVIVALDHDASHESWAAAEQLKLMGVDAHFLQLPMGHDPGTAPPHIIRDALERLR